MGESSLETALPGCRGKFPTVDLRPNVQGPWTSYLRDFDTAGVLSKLDRTCCTHEPGALSHCAAQLEALGTSAVAQLSVGSMPCRNIRVADPDGVVPTSSYTQAEVVSDGIESELIDPLLLRAELAAQRTVIMEIGRASCRERV